MVRVHVIDVVVQGEDDHFVVILADEDNQRILPIWIGPAEGQVIAMHLLNKESPRPMTHRFVADMLAALDVMVESVRVEALREITYYATVKFRHGAKEAEKSDEKVVEVDARPSDAIALALHMGCPIYAANAVIEKAGIDVPEEYQASPQQKGLEKVARLLDKRHQEHMAKLEAHREAGAGRQAKHETVARSELMDYLFGTPTE